ncbi:MAG TPA: lysozyme inhibitor LprI family protein [Acidimicrobiales bacterium]|jgi:uncharacterized protein YecT (DUF1311 family)
MRLRLLLLGLLATGLLALPGISAAAASTPAALRPPVIKELFTLLPCTQKTTLGMEGCAEHQIVAGDRIIDKAEIVLFSVLSHEAGPRALNRQAEMQLISAATTWLAYRRAECVSESAVNLGGSQAIVDSGQCEVALNTTRLAQLHAFYNALLGEAPHVPPFPAS